MDSKPERHDGDHLGDADDNEQHAPSREELLERCSELGADSDILAAAAGELGRSRWAGPPTCVLLILLAAVTRLFPKPVSIALGGPASAGKSYTLKKALAFLPPEAYYEFSSMSEKALIYLDASLEHVMLVIAEASGLGGDFLAYVVRTLLSEGRLSYLYTDFEKKRAVEIVKEGPTGLLTTSASAIDPELATRLLIPTVHDDPELTRQILIEEAREDLLPDVDLSAYHDLQRFVAAGSTGVTLPFAEKLARETDVTAVRVRRDFPAVLALTRAHALLHQLTRERDERGSVRATRDDYAAVYQLVAEMIAEGAERAIPPAVRETTEAVDALYAKPSGRQASVTQEQLTRYLGLDRSTVTRRVTKAVEAGFVANVGKGRGHPRLLVPGAALPEDGGVLPPPEALD